MSELSVPFWVACADCDPLATIELPGVREYDTWLREHRESTGHRNQLRALSRESMDQMQAPYRKLIEGTG